MLPGVQLLTQRVQGLELGLEPGLLSKARFANNLNAQCIHCALFTIYTHLQLYSPSGLMKV